ncbi:MAG: hypothetical protein U0Q22_13810 [Acidimicrobiales bacterium]
MTRTPMAYDSAEVNDSTWPSKTRTEVDRPCPTMTSICSDPVARCATERASSSRSTGVSAAAIAVSFPTT